MKIGRRSVFHPKINDPEHRYQGWLTEIGRDGFETARQQLMTHARKRFGELAPTVTSDADTIEYLVRTFMEARTMRLWRNIEKGVLNDMRVQ